MFFNDKIIVNDMIGMTHRSSIGALSECLSEMKELNLMSDEASVFLVENHAMEAGVPQTDVLLYNAFSLEVDEKSVYFSFRIGVSMFDDVNLHRHYEAMSYLFDRFKPMTTFNLFANDGNKKAVATIIHPSLVSPITKVDIRTYQTIDINCVCDNALR